MTTTESAFADLQPASNASKPVHPRLVMKPGWYWKLLDAYEAGEPWTVFTRDNPSVKTRKTRDVRQTTEGPKGAWVLFEVTGTKSVLWTLPGLPSKAPNGAQTEYSDVIDIPDDTMSATDMLEEFLRGLQKQLALAGKVVLWGGAGLILLNIAQLTRGKR